MIEVTYYREHNRLTIQGHARSDEYGRDLICAAASTLALTLSANVGHMARSGCIVDPVARLEAGDAEISCKPRIKYRDSVRQIFMSICAGFEILTEEYPEYIRYTVHG